MHESGENYLETILMIKEKKGVVRSIDVARALNFSKPSVSRAMGLLRDQGFISMEQGGDIQLTEEGLAKAKSIYARHLLLTAFLQEVTGVSEEMAEENACRMEHILDQEVVDGISTYMSKSTESKEYAGHELPGILTFCVFCDRMENGSGC